MQWRKSPQELIDLFVSVMPGPPAVQRKMFGYPAGFINGNMFMGLFQDDMILRLPENLREEFLKIDGAKIFEPMPGRPMREYVAVPPGVIANRRELASWISRALEHTEESSYQGEAIRFLEEKEVRRYRKVCRRRNNASYERQENTREGKNPGPLFVADHLGY